MKSDTIIIILGLAALGVGGYMVYRAQKQRDIALNTDASNPNDRKKTTGNQIKDIAEGVSGAVSAIGGTIDELRGQFGGF